MGNVPKPWIASTKKRTPRSPAQLAQGVEIVAKTAGIFDETEADNARPSIDGRGNVVDRQAIAAARHGPELHAAFAEVEPGILIGRVFLGGDDHVIARLPGKPLGDDADAFAGILDEGDVQRLGMEQPAKEPTDLFDALEPTAIVDVAVLGQVGGVVGHGVLGPERQRCHGGVIEECPASRHRKFRSQSLPDHGLPP